MARRRRCASPANRFCAPARLAGARTLHRYGQPMIPRHRRSRCQPPSLVDRISQPASTAAATQLAELDTATAAVAATNSQLSGRQVNPSSAAAAGERAPLSSKVAVLSWPLEANKRPATSFWRRTFGKLQGPPALNRWAWQFGPKLGQIFFQAIFHLCRERLFHVFRRHRLFCFVHDIGGDSTLFSHGTCALRTIESVVLSELSSFLLITSEQSTRYSVSTR